jgi:hypothetical protein
LAARAAFAQAHEPVTLKWDAPTACGSAEEVEARIRRLLGPTRVSTSLRAEATITPNEAGDWHLKLLIYAGDLVGERNLDGKSCDDLAGAAAVALTLLLTSDQPPSDAGRASGGAAPSQPKAEESHARAPAASARRARGHALIGFPLASVGLGPLPKPALGAALAGGLSFEQWRWVMQERAWLSQTLSASGGDVAAEVAHVDATLWACRALGSTRLEAAPCFTLALQHVVARGSGAYVQPRTATATWLSVGLGLQARYALSPWLNVLAGIDGQIEVSRPQVAVDGWGDVGQLAPFALTITLGPEWIL